MRTSHSGKLVIVVIVGLGLAGTAYSLWYHYMAGRRALQFWSPAAATLIAESQKAECFLLTPPGADAGARAVDIGGRLWGIDESKDISQAKGFSNLRRALLLDAAFEWPERPTADSRTWRYAVRFAKSDEVATVIFSDDGHVAVARPATSEVALGEPAARQWRIFFDNLFARPAN